MTDRETLEAEHARLAVKKQDLYAKWDRIVDERSHGSAEYSRIIVECGRTDAEIARAAAALAEYDRTHPPETSDD